MKRTLATALVILVALLAGVACRSTPDAVQTPGAAEPQAAATSTPTAEPQPAPTTADTPTAEPQEATEPPAESTAEIYLVALDAAPEGEGIGCGDELVPVQVEIDPAAEPLEAALSALLAVDDEFYGQSGLYNALYQSDLEVVGVQVEDGTAFVALEGEVLLGGVCDTPRAQAQLEQTALAVEGIDEVELLLNGEPLRQVLAGEPVEQPTPGGPGAVGDVFMYMVLPENDGALGPQFGCSDSLIPVLVDVDPTVEPLSAAIENLLRVESEFYGETQLYNALYPSGLRLDSAEIDGGVARINLEGHVEIAGECDLPRFRTQLEQTALQFDTVEEVEITINGEPLETITGGAQGGLAPQRATTAGGQVLLFLVAPSAGGGFGCDDSLVAIQHEIAAPGAPLQAALEALLALEPSVYEPFGLYSVFAQSDLTVEGVDIDDGVAEIALGGELMLGGVCDNPRVVDQITWTATQFDTVDSVVITLNGAPIEEALSLR